MGADYLKYEFTRPDGVRVTTILQGGKAHITEETSNGSGNKLVMLERSQLTSAEVALLKEIKADPASKKFSDQVEAYRLRQLAAAGLQPSKTPYLDPLTQRLQGTLQCPPKRRGNPLIAAVRRWMVACKVRLLKL